MCKHFSNGDGVGKEYWRKLYLSWDLKEKSTRNKQVGIVEKCDIIDAGALRGWWSTEDSVWEDNINGIYEAEKIHVWEKLNVPRFEIVKEKVVQFFG